MKKMKWWMAWVGALGVCGVILAYLIYQGMSGYLGLQIVWVANGEIPVDTPLSASNFVSQQWPKRNIPADAILGDDIKEIEGKFSRTTILKDQLLVKRTVSSATSVREVNQNLSDNYVTISIPLDSTDMPIEEIKSGDVVSLTQTLRVTTEDGDKFESSYVAENVRIVKAVDDTKQGHQKIIVLVPREQAPLINTALVVGKVRIVVDPRPFKLVEGATK